MRGVPRIGITAAVVAAVFIVTLTAGLLYPRSLVHGSIRTGPRGLTDIGHVATSYTAAVAWAPHHRAIVLTVSPRTPCRLYLEGITSTAPQRDDVELQQTGRVCRGPRRVERFVLPLPLVWGAGQPARVRLPDRVLILPWKPALKRLA
jgi:hypothetical protein